MAKSKIDWNKIDTQIERTGKKIILPDDPAKMPSRAAAEALLRLAKAEEQVMDVTEIVDAYPFDALVAFHAALKEMYGWTIVKGRPTWFGEQKPDLITVKTGPEDEDFIQAPVGVFELPNIDTPINVMMIFEAYHSPIGRPCFMIRGQFNQAGKEIVVNIANRVREHLRAHSIYKGKAIRLNSQGTEINWSTPPEFFRTKSIQPEELILNPDELGQVQASLWAPVVHTHAAVKASIPLRRGVLFAGPYGTGKTMTARVTAKLAVDHGWTFILLENVQALAETLRFATRYQPAIVFAEDVDRIASSRDERGNDLLNTIDGVLSKDAKVITVLTTNHIEKLERAMLRPGRLDAVINIRAPEAEAVVRLLNLYGRDLIRKDEDLTKVGEALAGQIPASIREVVERSKLGMIYRGDTQIVASDLLATATGMKRHLELLNADPKKPTTAERLYGALGDAVNEQLSFNGSGKFAPDMGELATKIERIEDHVT